MVEWKKLSDVAVIKNGKDYKKLSNGNIPVFGTGGIMTYVDQFASDKPSVLLPRKGSIENIFYVDEPFWTVDTLYWTDIDTSKIDPKFLFVSLQRYNLKEFAYGGARPSLSQQILYNLDIPLPSLSEQKRIVGILDTFTASIDNLKEQIAQRRKQYEHYRDQLLDLEGKEGVEIKTLKDVFDTRNGYTPSTSNSQFWDDGIIPWFKMEDIRDNGRILNDSNLHITTSAIKGKGLFKANSIILATSATIGEHALITVEHLSNQRFTNFYPKECYLNIINMKFVYYYMYRIDEWCKQHINQGGFASVDMGGLYNLEIPLPSLQEQQRIVSILDTFEASIQNLEAQLSKREKQYEYYRNKLLTFE